MAKEKIYVVDDKEGKKEWVLNRKIHFFIQVNHCTQTGATQYISNLPLTEQQIKDIVAGVN